MIFFGKRAAFSKDPLRLHPSSSPLRPVRRLLSFQLWSSGNTHTPTFIAWCPSWDRILLFETEVSAALHLEIDPHWLWYSPTYVLYHMTASSNCWLLLQKIYVHLVAWKWHEWRMTWIYSKAMVATVASPPCLGQSQTTGDLRSMIRNHLLGWIQELGAGVVCSIHPWEYLAGPYKPKDGGWGGNPFCWLPGTKDASHLVVGEWRREMCAACI